MFFRKYSAVSLAVLALALPIPALAAPMDFDLPVQPLAAALKAVANASGLSLTVNGGLPDGKAAPALKGKYEPEDALRRLLAGSGLTVTISGNTAVITQQTGEIQLDKVSVTGAKTPDQVLQGEGTAKDGYLTRTISGVGPLGPKDQLDTPYSLHVVPQELMDNMQLSSIEDVLRENPFTQLNWPSTRNAQTYFTSRGFSVVNKTVDGLRVGNYEVDPIYDKERVEITSGLTGFLYGQADPGGSVNYVLKRPTAETFANVTLGNDGGLSPYAQADLGGPIDSQGKFGYRINVRGQTGDTEIDKQSMDKKMFSGAFDWHLTDSALLQFDYEHSDSQINGVPPTWVFPTGVPHPNPAPAADKLWSQTWLYSTEALDKGGAKLTWDINDTFTFRSAFTDSAFQDHFLTYNIASVAPNGHYLPFASNYYPIKYDTLSEFSFIDARFKTWVVSHKMTAGYYGNDIDGYSMPKVDQACMSPSGTIGYTNCTAAAVSPFSLASPLYVSMPSNFWTNSGGGWYKSSYQANRNFVIGDDVTLTKQVSLLVGANDAIIKAQNFNTNGNLSGSYDRSRVSPAASLMFKPIPWATTYVSYIEGLEQGQIVGAGYTNSGTVMAPMVSRQYETGIKASIGGTLLTMALYQIEKPNQYSNNATPLPTIMQNGRVSDKGIEFGATGKITDDLAVVGGLSFMDNKVKLSNDPLAVGKRPAGVADTLAKVYLEYSLPWVRGLSVNGGVNYTGDFAADAHNTEILPSVVTFDAGARYDTTLYGTPLTSRLYATNLLNKSYWMSSNFVGDPLRIMYSVTARF